MEFSLQQDALDFNTASSLILPLAAFEGSEPVLSASLAAADQLLNGAIGQAINSGDLTGKFKSSQLFFHAGAGPDRILVMGSGDPAKLNGRKFGQLTQAAWSQINTNPGTSVLNQLTNADSADLDTANKVRLSIEALVQACYRFDQFKSEAKPQSALPSMALVADASSQTQLEQSTATAQGMDLCRDLGNLPGNVCTPSYLAEQGHKLAANSSKVTTQVLEEAEMESLGMHSLLSVGKGSAEPSKLIIVNYQGGTEGAAPHVLVGKGITFDTGGISLKAGAAMDEMKFDMCGAASVIGTMAAVVEMALPIDIVAIVAAAENMPSGKATKPGDVVTSMSGLTIEILNTDAEGRLVLCDALTYGERYKPASVIDVATLTGAAVATFGSHVSAMLSNDDALAAELSDCGNASLDQVWQLPLHDEYQHLLDSNFADIANIGGPRAGTITAACFLSRFTKKFKWAHLDIAGSAWNSGAAKSATGRPVSLLLEYLRRKAA